VEFGALAAFERVLALFNSHHVPEEWLAVQQHHYQVTKSRSQPGKQQGKGLGCLAYLAANRAAVLSHLVLIIAASEQRTQKQAAARALSPNNSPQTIHVYLVNCSRTVGLAACLSSGCSTEPGSITTDRPWAPQQRHAPAG
jgi:hypothetical protein